MNKQELISKIKSLQDISSEEKAYLIELVNTKKKYGLVWEEKPEDVEEQLRSMLPVFKEVKERAIISENIDAPNHILIEGDNLHALTALSYTHEGKVDVIYIDPPYNTGNKDFKNKSLKKYLKKTKEKAIYKVFGSGKFLQNKYDEDKLNLISKMHEKGYRDAEIVKDTTYRTGKSKRYNRK